MATVTDPKTNEQTTPEAPIVERELFAAEVEMEGKSSNFFPLLLILGLVVVVGGTIYYFVKSARNVLTTPVATATIERVIASQTPAAVRFRTGTVVSSVDEKVTDPHYKLLTKAGVILTKPKGANSLIVNITGPGEKLLADIPGVQTAKDADGVTTYEVPLATRQLVSIDKITMIKPHLARVDYTWKWEANRLGNEFDASGSLVQSFTTWDRATLIKSYGVDFYHADPTKASVALVEANDGTWKLYVE